MGLLNRHAFWESGKIQFLPATSIAPNPNQPRKVFAPQELDSLANSIRSLGILQPLTVRRSQAGWELVAGERRLRAAQIAGLTHVPCLAIHADEQSSSLLALVENLQRKNLDFWEESMALSALISTYNLSQEEAAQRIGRSQSSVANKLRLLKLPVDVLSTLRDGGCSGRHARALLRLSTPALQVDCAQRIVTDGLSVAQTETMVEQLLTPPSPPTPPKPAPRRIFIPKDIRLFLNTMNRSVDLMRSAGVNACCQREDSDDEILLTIHIPKPTR